MEPVSFAEVAPRPVRTTREPQPYVARYPGVGIHLKAQSPPSVHRSPRKFGYGRNILSDPLV